MSDLIEDMAKACWDAMADEFNKWDRIGFDEKREAEEGIRAALRVLINADLSERIIDAGVQAIERAQRYGGATDEYTSQVVLANMLRALVTPPASPPQPMMSGTGTEG